MRFIEADASETDCMPNTKSTNNQEKNVILQLNSSNFDALVKSQKTPPIHTTL